MPITPKKFEALSHAIVALEDAIARREQVRERFVAIEGDTVFADCESEVDAARNKLIDEITSFAAAACSRAMRASAA
jgi:hypothetical protein